MRKFTFHFKHLSHLILIAFVCTSLSCTKSGSSDDQGDNNDEMEEQRDDKPSNTSYTNVDALNPKGLEYEITSMELQDNASIISYDEMEHVLDRTTFTYLFGPKAKSVKNLKPGQVIVCAGERVGKITKIEQKGNNTEITLARARLNEAFKEFDYEYELDVDWKDIGRMAAWQSNHPFLLADAGEGPVPVPPGNLDSGVNHKVTFKKNDYECEISLKAPNDNKLEFEVSAKKGG